MRKLWPFKDPDGVGSVMIKKQVGAFNVASGYSKVGKKVEVKVGKNEVEIAEIKPKN